jgi:uncharacterized protein (TIGR02001 family)
MRIKHLVRLAVCGLALNAAQPLRAAELGGGFSISGGATVTSDYRFRGISQTDRRFALQGTLGLSHSSGLYATLWGSSIDDYVAAGADAEIDLVLGYRRSFGGTTIDVGLLYYYYPGAGLVPGYNSDFVEPYVSVSHTFGPVTAKATANYAPSQAALSVGAGDEDNLYLAGDVSVAIPQTGLTVSGHLGHSFGPSDLTIGNGYTDWNVGVSYTRGPVTLSVQYVDTDGAFLTPRNRNASGSGVVGALGFAF